MHLTFCKHKDEVPEVACIYNTQDTSVSNDSPNSFRSKNIFKIDVQRKKGTKICFRNNNTPKGCMASRLGLYLLNTGICI